MTTDIHTGPNKARLRLWVAALRSGKYRQTTARLRANLGDGAVGMCCGGVACEVSGIGRWELCDGAGHHSEYVTNTSRGCGLLPKDVADWYGLPHANPDVAPDIVMTDANDLHLWSFDRIADSIETLYRLNEETPDGEDQH